MSEKVCYETVRRLRQKFMTGTESIKDAAKSGRPVTVTDMTNASKVKKIFVYNSRVHFILKQSKKDFCQMDTPYIDR